MNAQKEKAIQYEMELKSKLYDLQKKLATRSGFVNYYYTILAKCKNFKAAYDLVSLMYYKLFNEYLFSSYHAFIMYRKKCLKK